MASFYCETKKKNFHIMRWLDQAVNFQRAGKLLQFVAHLLEFGILCCSKTGGYFTYTESFSFSIRSITPNFIHQIFSTLFTLLIRFTPLAHVNKIKSTLILENLNERIGKRKEYGRKALKSLPLSLEKNHMILSVVKVGRIFHFGDWRN